ncbi:hypothetical protein [Bradyrhizobium sp.]|uniref:hypothetical protein n=1 Tax=Bradyrhizobium sp. TaxID=376 RepID=UPI00239CD2EB|nr:hypothetical protein [Bradyrhizobium sp.]MDE1933571.1 hypothetical protein [Bradyrhizobium sp.]
MLSEIRPADAPPDIAAIYDDISATSGVPVVNLIWRHFASLPGVLAWAWTAVRPLVGSMEMETARARIARGVALPAIARPAQACWAKAGIDAAMLPELRRVMAAYVRGNLTNMVALTALRMRLDAPERPAVQLTPAPAQPVAAPLPTLPRIEMLPIDLTTVIRALAASHDGAGNGVIPSLYLALAPWPGVVMALATWLGSLYVPQAMRAARESVVRAAEAEAAVMLPVVGPAPEGLAVMRPTLDRFTRLVIPDMIPVCIALDDLLPTQ